MMQHADDDIDLMLRFQNGEDKCFEILVERHKQRVFNITYRYLGNVHEAEDAAQQVFMNIYHAKKQYKPTAQFTTWLYTVCKNTCLKTFRRKRHPTISLDDSVETDHQAVSLPIPDAKASTPLEHTLTQEQETAVKEAIHSLPDNQRIVVILHKYEELPYERIASITGLSVQAVKSLLHRARLNLKEKLAKYFEK